MTRTPCLQVRHGDIDHGREPNHVHRNRIPLGPPSEGGIVECYPGTDDKEFDVFQLFDQLSHEWHGQFWLIRFRPPYGKRLVGLPWYLWRPGRTTVFWTLDPDSFLRDHEAMVHHVLDNVRPGAIILLHVELRPRAEERLALPMILAGLRERGYRVATVSELLAAEHR